MSNPFIDAYLKIITESRKDDYAQQLENKGVENASEMAEYLFQYNNPKKEKAALYWLLKGAIELPKDQDRRPAASARICGCGLRAVLGARPDQLDL